MRQDGFGTDSNPEGRCKERGMRQMHTIAETAQAPENNGGSRPGSMRGRAQAFAETLASSRRQGESLSELAHDARNMVMALALYCELLEEPGVLSLPCRHYASELRLVAASSRRLVEKLALLGKREAGGATKPVALAMPRAEEPI